MANLCCILGNNGKFLDKTCLGAERDMAREIVKTYLYYSTIVKSIIGHSGTGLSAPERVIGTFRGS